MSPATVMANDTALDRLLSVLDQRVIRIARKEIQWAFESPKTGPELAWWVEERLGPETILTKEELEIYEKLERRGLVKELETSPDLATLRPCNEDEMRATIRSLESSTASIDRQIAELRSQQTALSGILTERQEIQGRREQALRQRNRTLARERQHINLAAEELSQNLASRLSSSTQHAKSAQLTLETSVTQLLKGDNNTLAMLESLALSLRSINDNKQEEVEQRVHRLVEKLIQLKSKEMYCRLDRIYLENSSSSVSPDHDPPSEAELEGIREELDSLYSEVASVSEMSTKEEFLRPYQDHVASRNARTDQISQSALRFICDTLSHLTERLEMVTARAQAHRAYSAALEVVHNTAHSEIYGEAPIPKSPSKASAHNGIVDKISGKPSSKHDHPPLPAATVDSTPGHQLLRQVGISVPLPAQTAEAERVLNEIVKQRQSKLLNQLTDVVTTTETSIAAHLGETDRALQILLDALYEKTPYHHLRLSDPGIQTMIDSLERKVSELGRDTTKLDLEDIHLKNFGDDKFLKRWAA